MKNVRVTISDLKAWDDDGDNIPEGGEFYADTKSYNNYYAFGSPQPGRSYSPTGYRYGFNGKEKLDELHGNSGDAYDYGMRMYDARLGKFLSVDPIAKDFPFYTPYQYAGNKPISCLDIDGLEDVHYSNTFKNGGNSIMLALFSATGLKRQMEAEFAKANSKYDLYIVVVKTSDGGGVYRNSENKLQDAGEMEGTFKLAADRKDYKEVYTTLKNQGLDPMQTIKAGKTPIVIEVSDDFAKTYENEGFTNHDRELGLTSLKVGIFTIFHGFDHANKAVEGKNTDPLGRDDHQQLYGNDYDSPTYDWYGTSPSYFKIGDDKNAPATKAKDKIENTVNEFDNATKQ